MPLTYADMEEIAHNHFGILTLETRNRDCLDFHEVAVWSIQKALTEAYMRGRVDALREANARMARVSKELEKLNRVLI